jgi:DNA polymerase-3 subunit gamma/tau
MSDSENQSPLPSGTPGNDSKYTVVARRYRPKDFTELVGQTTIVQALTTAIQTHRVGHAYLFTGARGVGKTSTARIFAKALNASGDGSGGFDLESDVAQAIDAGEDIDVLEIDGASNRGIDEIRQLRANVAVRPSRSPYKIYIIDEVHMLTGAAFNALLKTLEEPPPHVKFIFCTTDPEKIPITVLSRCQRFDFAPVKIDQIIDRLKFICDTEGAVADAAALLLIARRAAGSMRDSQSLLEQILSFSAGNISAETVHSILGTADETRLASIADALIARNPASVLQQLEDATEAGVDPGQLGEQLLGYLRDMMTIGIGASAELLRTASANRANELREASQTWGTTTLLSAIQVLDEALVKMRHSTQSRILLEVGLVQICQLEDLQSISDLLQALQSGKQPPVATSPRSVNSVADSEKKKPIELAELANPNLPPSPVFPKDREFELPRGLAANSLPSPGLPGEGAGVRALHVGTEAYSDSLRQPEVSDIPELESSAAGANEPLPQNPTPFITSPDIDAAGAFAEPCDTPEERLAAWQKIGATLDGFLTASASMVVRVDLASNGTWKMIFPQGCDFAVDECNSAQHRSAIQSAMRCILGREIAFEFHTSNLPPPVSKSRHAGSSGPATTISQPALIRKYMEHPLVKGLLQSIEGEIVRVDLPRPNPPPSRSATIPEPHSKPNASQVVESIG